MRVPAGTPPLDGLTSPTGAYGFRKLRSAYAGAAIRLRRASDNLEADIGFLGFVPGIGAPWDEAAAASHCGASTCFARWWYDQSGLAKDVGEAVGGNQPQLVFNCKGGLPCLRTTAAQVLQTASAAYVPTSPVSVSAVGNRSAGTGICYWPIQYPGNSLAAANGAANTWSLFAGTAVTGGAADNQWHAGIGVIAGAASVLSIDGTETTGTATVNTTPGALVGFWGSASTTCNVGEVLAWSGYALTAAERTALTNNQRRFWGF